MIYKMCKRIVKKDRNKHKYAIVAYVLAVMVESIVSESAINFVGSGCAFIILGLINNNSKGNATKETNYENRSFNFS